MRVYTGALADQPAIATLGKLLLRAQVLSATQLAAGLRQQVVYGGRLGTNLLELGYCTHDQIAQGLAQLHGVPAALTRHLRGADSRVRELVPVGFCRQRALVPLAYATAGGRQLVVCMKDPRDEATLDVLRQLTGLGVVGAACPELSVFRLLKHFYAVPLPARMLAAVTGNATTPLPRSQTSPLDTLGPQEVAEAPTLEAVAQTMPTLSLVGLDHASVERDPTQLSGDSDRLSLSELASRLREKRASEMPPAVIENPRPTEVVVLSDGSPSPSTAASAAPSPVEMAPSQPANGSIPRRRTHSSLSEALADAAESSSGIPLPPKLDHSAIVGVDAVDLTQPVPIGPPPMKLEEALAEMQAASERAAVSSAVIGFLKSHFEGGVILVVRDEIAYGYRGFGGHFDEESVESIIVPLGPPSPFKMAYQEKQRYVGAGVTDEKSLFGRFLLLFPLEDGPELTIVEPVELRERVVCLIYAHVSGESELADDAFDELESIAEATGKAFLRLIKAQRQT